MEESDKKSYVIAGRWFHQEALTLGQIKWFYRALKGYRLTNMTEDQVLELFMEKTSTLLSILLVPDEQTREQKFKAGEAGRAELEVWLEAHAQPEEVAAIARDFIASDQLPRLIQAATSMLAQASSMNGGLTRPSSSSPAETSEVGTGSSGTSH